MDRLADDLLGAERWVADRFGDPEMPDLRVGEVWSIVLIGPHGTPALVSSSTQ
jgi:hypothetical protein